MNKPKVLITAGALLISTALAVTLFAVSNRDSAPLPSEVYTWECEFPEQKPEAITITCGDGGQYIDGITWDTWGASGAQGSGTYHVNDCEPNCAEGNFLSAPVTIQLSNLSTFQSKSYLRTMTFESRSGENLPNLGQSFYQWDVMEFAEMMAE